MNRTEPSSFKCSPAIFVGVESNPSGNRPSSKPLARSVLVSPSATSNTEAGTKEATLSISKFFISSMPESTTPSVNRSTLNNMAPMDSLISPTSVIPPRTGCVALERPKASTPPISPCALTIIGPRIVEISGIEKSPLTPETEFAPKVSTSTPGTPPPPPSTTVPTTVVSGSGITLIVIVSVVVLPRLSVAVADTSTISTPMGATKSNPKGPSVTVPTASPSTKKSTFSIATLSVAVTATEIVTSSMKVSPSAGDVMPTVGGGSGNNVMTTGSDTPTLPPISTADACKVNSVKSRGISTSKRKGSLRSVPASAPSTVRLTEKTSKSSTADTTT